MASLLALAPVVALGLFLSIQCFQLPSQAQLELSKSLIDKRAGDRSHWCCKGDLTPVIKHVTRLEAQRYIITKNVTYTAGYVPCDPEVLANETWRWCKDKKTEIVNTPAYRLVKVSVDKPETPTCRETDLVCCEGFSLFMDNCYEPDELKIVKSLIESGLVG